MNYSFLNQQLKANSCYYKQNEFIQEHKHNQRVKFTILTIIFIMVYDMVQAELLILYTPWEYYIYVCSVGFTVEIIFGIVMLCYKRNKLLYKIIKRLFSFVVSFT